MAGRRRPRGVPGSNLRDGIALGEDWEQRLHDELRGADAVVCVLTSAYLASHWCTAEVSIARSRGSRLLGPLAELLRSPAEHAKGAALLVVGPSGCGKSSLVRAGLLPVPPDQHP